MGAGGVGAGGVGAGGVGAGGVGAGGVGAGGGVGVGFGGVVGVGVGVGAGVVFGLPTVIAKGASRAVETPSDTEITMFEYTPALRELGMPYNTPRLLLNHVQPGELATLNRSARPLLDFARGMNA